MTEDVERQPLLGGGGAGGAGGRGDGEHAVEQNGGSSVTTVSPIGPDEMPPPYNSISGGTPMVNCRVCSIDIDISGKKDQVLLQTRSINKRWRRARRMRIKQF